MKVIKTLSKILFTVISILVASPYAKAQTGDERDSIKKQLDKLLLSKDPSQRQMLLDRLKSLAASDVEINMAIAGSYYFQLKNNSASDSVFTAEVIKFPKGLQARIKAQQAISRISRLPELEKAYISFIWDFPPDSYPRLPFGEDRLPYDRLRGNLANRYAKERQVVKANYYAGLLEADFWKGKSYGDLSSAFFTAGDLANAARYQKKAVDSAHPFADGKMGDSPTASFAAKGYADICRSYSEILYRQKKYTEALNYIKVAFSAKKVASPEYSYLYAEILTGLKRYQEAYTRIESAVRSGVASKEMSDLFTVLYIKVKGSKNGLDAYQADINKGITDNLRKILTKNMLNQPAANFSLTDLQGNRVSLGDLKGKIVILDFWATWCEPCKASFPAMQMAVDKYKSDPDVRFLFIHTWERSPTAADDAKAYIAGMNYSFQVLMDTVDTETKANMVVESYKTSSIPAKFVIDGKGNIRFKLVGFSGSKEAAVDEIAMMINMIRADKN